jgi:predicted MPP superfamily phosphohydrolase
MCVLTGDYRGQTFGPFEVVLAGMASLRAVLRDPVYGVLGNHDSIRMMPGLEEMGIRMLLNEHEIIARGGERIHLAGVDDAHFYRMDNIAKAAAGIPHDEFSILASHTPEIFRQAAHADFNLLLSGHTHGGQICLPGGIPITLGSRLPRSLGAGAWKYHDLIGYTSVGAGSSVVPVRFNCPPEITLHHLGVGCSFRFGTMLADRRHVDNRNARKRAPGRSTPDQGSPRPPHAVAPAQVLAAPSAHTWGCGAIGGITNWQHRRACGNC